MKNKLYTKNPANVIRRWIILTCFMLLSVFATVVKGQVSVTATAGTLGPTAYTTVKLAFDAINNGTHQGDITVSINANTTEGATPAVLNSNGAGLAQYTSVLITPTVDGVITTGSPGAGRGVIELNGADNVTIDGDNAGTGGTNRNYTVTNSNGTAITASSCIRIATSTIITTANNNTIKNCILNGNVIGGNSSLITSTTGSSNSSFGIYCGGNASTVNVITAPSAVTSVTGTMAAGATINTLLIDNNEISQCARAIVFGGAGTASSTGVTITNNVIGSSTAPPAGTAPYPSPSTTVYTKGIWVTGLNAVTISGNTIQNLMSYVATVTDAVECSSTSAIGTSITINNNTISNISMNSSTTSTGKGIFVASGTGATLTISGNTITNIQSNTGSSGSNAIDVTSSYASATIEKNKICTVFNRNTGIGGARGISTSSGSNSIIRNNFISDINQPLGTFSNFFSSFGVYGIYIGGGTGHKVYHNSVNLFGAMTGTASAGVTTSSAALAIAGTGQTGCDIRNNILSNTITGGLTPNLTAHVSLFLPSGGTSMGLTLNNNNYYTGSTAGVHGIAHVGTTYTSPATGLVGLFEAANFDAANTTPVTNLRNYTSTIGSASNDNASRGTTVAAPFTSSCDLHVTSWTGGSEGGDFIANKGAVVAVTTDIDGEQRPYTGNLNPAIGADEQTSPPCSSNNGGTLLASASACVGASAFAIPAPTGVSGGPGIAYQWYTADDNLGTNPVPVVGGSGATTVSYTTPAGLAAGVYYYVLGVKCSGGPEGFSTVLTFTVYALPVTAVAPASANYCNPGPGVDLTASGASTYTWSPSGSLTASTGSNVAATPASNTVYTVTGTANGCSATATTSITVLAGVSLTSLTANPTGVCSGGNSTLTATAVLTADASSYSFTSSSGVFTSLSGGTTVTAVQADDAVSGLLPIGFNFKYNGITYTSLIASSNGWLSFNPSATSSAANSLSASAATRYPLVAPLWDDLDGTARSASYLTTGSPGSQVFTFEWLNFEWDYLANTPVISFQVKLYEADNHIEFVYQSEAGAYSTSGGVGGASIGIATAAGKFLSLDGTGVSPAASSVTETSNLAIKPATGQVYSFSPPVPNYSWSPSTFLSATTGSTVSATNVTATTTYTVTVSAPSGCSTSSTVTLSAGAALTCSALTASASTCFGLSTVTANPAAGSPPYTYAWTEDGTAIAPTTQTITASVGTHTYNCQITDLCGLPCNAGDLVVTTNALPVISVSPTSALLCNPGSVAVTLDASGGLSYTWSPVVGLSATTGSSVSALPTTTTTYTVSGTDINGCVNSATSSITVGNHPYMVISPLSSNICNGSSQVLNISDSYSNIFTSNTNISIPTVAGTGTPYPATLTVSGVPVGAVLSSVKIDGFNHSFPSDLDILLRSPGGSDVVLMSDVWNGTDGVNISLTIEDGAATTMPSADIVSGSYKPTNSGATDAFPAPGPASITQATPTLASFGSGDLNGDWSLFVNDQFNTDGGNITSWSLTFVLASDPSVVYTWSPSGSLSSSTGASVTATPLANTEYTVVASNASGCTSTGTATVNVGAALVCSPATVSSPVCAGSDFTVTANVSGGGEPYSYSWSDGSTTVYPATASITANLPAGSYTFDAVVTDNCGATCQSSVSVTVNALPAVAVNPTSGLICNPGGSAITLTASNGISYSWSPESGLDATTGSTVSANPSVSTDYTVVGTDANGCVNSAVASITVGSNPVISANPAVADICNGASVDLNVNTTYTGTFTSSSLISIPSSGTATPYPSTLSVSGVPGGAVLKSVNLNGITHTFPSDIDIMLQSPLGTNVVLMSDVGGFSAITNVSITLEDLLTPVAIPSPPVDGSTYSPTNSGASDDWAAPGPGLGFSQATPTLSMFSGNMNGTWNLLVVDDASGDLGSLSGWSLTFEAANDPSLTFTWSPASGLSATTGAPVTASPSGNTQYTVTATNASGCTSTATVQVNVGSPIICTPATASSPLCANSNFTVTSHVSGGGAPYTYSWSDGSTTVYPATASITANLPAGTYNFTCLVTDDCGATCSSDVTVTVNGTPAISVSPVNGQICNPGGTAISLTASGGTTYSWSPSAGLSATTGSDVTALPSSSTVYTVSSTDGNGCVGIATSSIQVGYTPTGVTASANPTTVCAGDFSQLSSTGTDATPSIPFYSFSASSGVFTSLSGGTNVPDVEDDEVVSAVIPLGFSFNYDGTTYTGVYASTNGFLSFNPATGSSFTNSLNAPPVGNVPLIAPLWDDMDGFDAGGSANYQTSGLPGNQVFTFEWLNWEWNWLSDVATINFQVKLYESDGHIEFIYEDAGNAGSPGGSGGASIGLAGSGGTYLSLNNSGASPVASSSTATNDISAKPANGQVYTFTPPALALSYSWQPAAGLKPNANVQNPETPALPAGTTVFTVTVTSNGCSATATASVTSGEPLICSPVTTTGPLCSSGFTATAHHTGGGTPYNYAWSDGVGGVYPNSATVPVNLAAGTYSLECVVSDACGETCLSSLTVIVEQAPTASIVEGTTVNVCTADLPINVTLHASTDVGTTYQWYKDDIGMGGQTASTLVVTSAGSYKVAIKNGACETFSVATVVAVVSNPPAPGATPSNIDVCTGASSSGDFSAVCASTQTVTFSGGAGLPLIWPASPGTTPSLPNFDIATLPVAFPAGAIVTDIEVSVNIAHTWGGDIEMVLEAPNGDFVGLLMDPNDGNKDFGGGGGTGPTLPYTFSSTGAAVPASGAVASPGPYAPVTYPGGVVTTFADFLGDDPNGTWNLYIGDGVGGDGGAVENWTMTITVTLPPSTVNWYSVPSGGSSLSSNSTFNPITDGGASTAAAGVQTFYAECSNSGCASPRTPVTLTVLSCGVTLNSNMFLQGYYSGGGLMEVAGAGTLFIDGVAGAAATDADTVRITAVSSTCPYTDVQEQLGILHTDGTISVTFTSPVTAGNSYYLKITHRNSVETWSAAPVLFSAVTTYNFASAATQAFSANQADLGDGNFAIFTGDINHDGAVDGSDFLELDPSIQNGDGGYAIGDLNGDGAVDGSDFLVLDPNIQNGVGAAIPFCP